MKHSKKTDYLLGKILDVCKSSVCTSTVELKLNSWATPKVMSQEQFVVWCRANYSDLVVLAMEMLWSPGNTVREIQEVKQAAEMIGFVTGEF